MNKPAIAVAVAIATYFGVGFGTIGYFTEKGERICDLTRPVGLARGACYQANAYKSVMLGMFWPVTVPFHIGALIVQKKTAT